MPAIKLNDIGTRATDDRDKKETKEKKKRTKEKKKNGIIEPRPKRTAAPSPLYFVSSLPWTPYLSEKVMNIMVEIYSINEVDSEYGDSPLIQACLRGKLFGSLTMEVLFKLYKFY